MFELAGGPAVVSWYPNYNSDPSILICPSDPGDDVDSLKDSNGDWNFWRPGASDDIDASYIYLGWIFDRMQHPTMPPVPLSVFSSIGAAASAGFFDLPSNAYVSMQFGAGLDTLLGMALQLLLGGGPYGGLPPGIALMRIVESDWDVQPVNGIPTGNGGTDKIYRLKEGNERFMITDVNSPQTAALAQSSIWAMMDTFGNYGAVKYFNHVPGGCNVLFMDGHVDWVPYVPPTPNTAPEMMDLGAQSPVLPSVADLVGMF